MTGKGTMIYFKPEDLDLLKAEASRQARETETVPSVSRVVRQAVREYLEKRAGK